MRFKKLRYWLAGKLVRLAERLASSPAEYIYGPDDPCDCFCRYIEPYGFVPEHCCLIHDPDGSSSPYHIHGKVSSN